MKKIPYPSEKFDEQKKPVDKFEKEDFSSELKKFLMITKWNEQNK